MDLASSLFDFAVENEYIDKNPVPRGLIPKKSGRAKDRRDIFSDPEDLDLIFERERFLDWSRDKPERFWVPLLALFTGCRLEEACQLYAEDVKQVEGRWCIQIKGLIGADGESDAKGQSLKNESAARIIPLHPTLVDVLKFPEYVQGLALIGDSLIFPDLTKSEKTNWKFSHGLSKSFGLYLRKKVGITDKKKAFHSFRHTVADHLYNKPVEVPIIEELQGRAGKTETSKTYTKGLRVPVLYKEAILKLDYKVDLSHLKASKWVPKDTDGPE
jgi:integrase